MNLTPNKILSVCIGLFLSLYLTRITCYSACISMQISNSIHRIFKIGKKKLTSELERVDTSKPNEVICSRSRVLFLIL